MNSEAEKKCPYCNSKISEEVKKCPHCHEWVRFSLASPRTANYLGLIVTVALILGLAYVVQGIQHSFDQSGEKASNLVIVNHFREERDDSIVVFGELKNNGTERVKSASVEVTFLDAENKFVDRGRDFITGGILPSESVYFKISLGCGSKKLVSTHRYKTYKVKVTDVY